MFEYDEIFDKFYYKGIDFKVTYTREEDDTPITRTALVRFSGEFPMVDFCPIKSGRVKYILDKKIMSGCSHTDLFEYEKMSKVKADVVGITKVKVSVIYPGKEASMITIPLRFNIDKTIKGRLLVKISDFPEIENVDYMEVKKYFTRGRKIRTDMDTDKYMRFCESCKIMKPEVLSDLKRRWMVESL